MTKGRKHDKITMYYRNEYFDVTSPNETYSYRVCINDSPAFSKCDAYVVPTSNVFRIITSKGKELHSVQTLYDAILLACDLVLLETGLNKMKE